MKTKCLLFIASKVLKTEATVDLLVNLLTKLSKKTDNKIDDAAVEIISRYLYSATRKEIIWK